MKRFFFYIIALFPLFLSAQPAQKHYLQFNKAGDLQAFLHYDADRVPMISAHRGGRNIPGFPENAIETFDYVLSKTPAIIEFDVRMSKDSVLLLMHDYDLDRTTTGTGKVAEKLWSEIEPLFLKDDFGKVTTFKVPLFSEALAWAKGKTILTVDVKRGVPYAKVISAIEAFGMEEYAAVITYNANSAKEVNQLNPQLMISVGIRNQEDLQRLQSYGIPTGNMIAFTGTSEPSPDLYKMLHENGIQCILGTLGNLDKSANAKGDQLYNKFILNGADILATDRPLEASKAIQKEVDSKSKKMRYFKSSK